MKLSEDLTWRGLVKDKTFNDLSWLDKPQTFYHGVDCSSSDSLTIGNLAALLLAYRLSQAGWKTVLLVGGATSLVGDPGGKNQERDLKPKEEIASNAKKISAQVKRLFNNQEFTLVNNMDWLSGVGFLDFLREVGKHFSMTELTQRDYIIERMGEGGSGISYAEFSYTLIQGYDFWHIYKEYGAMLQVGGSDQWGNMLSGVALIRKKEDAEAHAFSMPLVVDKTTGRKFGKSEAGALWLDSEKTSPYKFYQFWLNLDDDSVLEYLKMYTLLGRQEIERIMDEFSQSRAERLAQKTLAYEVTKIVHGEDTATSVRRITETLFSNRGFSELKVADFAELKKELPVAKVKFGETHLIDVLIETGLANSKKEARHFVSDGAVYVNGAQTETSKDKFSAHDAVSGHIILRRGKNAQAVIEVI